jgi:hypothetical protein
MFPGCDCLGDGEGDIRVKNRWIWLIHTVIFDRYSFGFQVIDDLVLQFKSRIIGTNRDRFGRSAHGGGNAFLSMVVLCICQPVEAMASFAAAATQGGVIF